MDFKGKVVIITGASSGIGAATAKCLAEAGASLVLTGRNIENLQKIGRECELVGKVKPLLLTADICSEDDNGRVIAKTVEKFGKLDVLVNNAGKGAYGSIESTSLSQLDDVMNTNLRGVFHLTQLAVPHLVKSKGNVVNVSSVAGTRSFPNSLAYSLSKAALDQFTRCVALELAPKGVRVNFVNPAVIMTDFLRRMGIDEPAYDAYMKRSEESHALGRVGQAPEVAAAIGFLASDAASFITGSQLCVDGGKNVMCPR